MSETKSLQKCSHCGKRSALIDTKCCKECVMKSNLGKNKDGIFDKCSYVNDKGERCKYSALLDEKFCGKHMPSHLKGSDAFSAEEKGSILEKIVKREITQKEVREKYNIPDSTLRRWISNYKKNKTPIKIDEKYDSGEMPIPPKNKKATDLSLEAISDICKNTALLNLGKDCLSKKELMEKYGIKAKDTIRKIITERQVKHYEYWLQKLKD